ncbi:MAG: ABC transporter permease [Lentisphaerae bacterium]|nr:ABC transporter permease [Lentisphaerota bacterium]
MLPACTIAHTLWLSVLRRKDAYVLLILLAALPAALASLDIFGLGGAVRYVTDVGLLMAWLFGWILAVIVSTRELPAEEQNGTIFPLLAKPVSRWALVAGKWLGAWLAVTAATVCFYLVIAGITLLRGGSLSPAALLQAVVLHAAALAVLAAAGILFSTRLHGDAAATLTFALSAASFLVVPRIPEFLAQRTGWSAGILLFLYHLLPHFEVFDLRKRLVHDYGPADGRTVALVVLYGAALAGLFLCLAWLAYRNKRFERGRA